MSLEAARTRMRLHQAYLATLLPESGATTLMGMSVCPIRSPVFQTVSIRDSVSARLAVVATAAPSSACTELPPDRASL